MIEIQVPTGTSNKWTTRSGLAATEPSLGHVSTAISMAISAGFKTWRVVERGVGRDEFGINTPEGCPILAWMGRYE